MLVYLSDRITDAVLAAAEGSDTAPSSLGKAIHEALGVIDAALEDFGCVCNSNYIINQRSFGIGS